VIVVTGGAGYLGTVLVTRLLERGEQVRVVDLREPATVLQRGATWCRADVRDVAAMRDAVKGSTVVYHLAAVISVVGPMRGLVDSVNVGGVRTVAAAALEMRVPRLVHCSSVHAYDLAAQVGRVVDERTARCTDTSRPAYDRSKAAGEAELRRWVERGLDAVVVNPTGVIGAPDESPSRMGAALLALWRRRLPAVVPGGFDWVDVSDVAEALMAAERLGRTGESYLIPGHRRSLTELADLARACSAKRLTGWVAPGWSVRMSVPLATVIARMTGSPLLPTREAIAALDSFPIIDGGKAARELGHAPRPIEQTMSDLYQWFRVTGRIRVKPGTAG
jgi:dihydroflavonol-4-reductase